MSRLKTKWLEQCVLFCIVFYFKDKVLQVPNYGYIINAFKSYLLPKASSSTGTDLFQSTGVTVCRICYWHK